MRHKLVSLDADIWDQWHTKNINVSEMQNRYVKEYGDDVLNAILEHNEHFESSMLKGWEPHGDLLDIVRTLNGGYKKFIWSSNTRKTIETVLAEENLSEAFDRIVTRNDVKFVKPNPEGFKLIYEPGVLKSRYLLIGDSQSDKGAAEAAGIDFFFMDFFGQRL